MANSIYYNVDKLISYNALLNFVFGERGVGKTYGTTKFVIRDYINHDNEFVYLRRYNTELEQSVPQFFDAVNLNNEFEGYDLEVKGDRFLCNSETCGYAVALSTANILKSRNFSKVRTIIFDEFVIDQGNYHYLKNEVTKMLDIIETIARMREIRVIFLGNAISISNPYFDYFNLQLPYKKEYRLFKDGMILVNYVRNEAYREAKKQTRFGKLIDGTPYGQYAIDNSFLRDDKTFLGRKPGHAKNYSTLIVNGRKYGLWQDYKGFATYISHDYDPSNPCTFAAQVDDHTIETVLINPRTSPWVRPMLDSYRKGRLYFETQTIKNDCMKIITRCLT